MVYIYMHMYLLVYNIPLSKVYIVYIYDLFIITIFAYPYQGLIQVYHICIYLSKFYIGLSLVAVRLLL